MSDRQITVEINDKDYGYKTIEFFFTEQKIPDFILANANLFVPKIKKLEQTRAVGLCVSRLLQEKIFIIVKTINGVIPFEVLMHEIFHATEATMKATFHRFDEDYEEALASFYGLLSSTLMNKINTTNWELYYHDSTSFNIKIN